MSRRITLLSLALLTLLAMAAPALAAPNPNKDLCKGSDYIFSVLAEDGRQISEAVYLSWENQFASPSVLDAFPNQGQCVSHLNQGGTMYFVPCEVLKGKEIREAAMCYTRAWIMSPSGQ